MIVKGYDVPASVIHAPNRLTDIAATLGVAVDDLSRPPPPHVLYASENGDRWLLMISNDRVFVQHVGNMSSGAHTTEIPMPTFLMRDVGSPQHQALVQLIETVLAAHLSR